jgi:poly-gamma-glutamate synthesis protein (capsule biosynthesis protein)
MYDQLIENASEVKILEKERSECGAGSRWIWIWKNPRYVSMWGLLLCFLWEMAAWAQETRECRARLVFVGDIMVHKEQIQGALKGNVWNFTHQFRRVKPLFQNAFVVGNLETVFAGEKRGFAGYPSFNTPDELTDALSDLGVDLVTLANNHILDRGLTGAARTITVLDSADILWTGLGRGEVKPNEPLFVEYAGFRWAFVNYSYGSNHAVASSEALSSSEALTSGDVLASGDVRLNLISNASVESGLAQAWESSPDIVVACFHWGNEYQFIPTKRQREAAAFSVERGAHIVIGTHPHVLQPMEITSSDRGYSLTAYSLGNFISYQRIIPRERSAILAVDVEKKHGEQARISHVSVAPIWVSTTRPKGKFLIETVYAGTSPRFNHAGLSPNELWKARQAGKAVLEFLGAAEEPDGEGFYTLWNAASPDHLPQSRRKMPQ